MIQRIVMPLRDNSGMSSRVTGHPGRAPYFGVVELEGDQVVSFKIVQNPYASEHDEHQEHHDGHMHGGFFAFLVSLRPTAVITYTIGPGAFYRLKDMGIRIYRPKGHTVEENIRAFLSSELEELAQPVE
ncbi:MAG: NifB/NifX family molybdenum-iron cluster-binding protein [Nitrososphaeria archaeon]